jgi:hypothetical protein
MSRRGRTYAGGLMRPIEWARWTMYCRTCNKAIALAFQTDAVTTAETARDLYRALRRNRWHARLERDHSVTAWCSFHCVETDYDA